MIVICVGTNNHGHTVDQVVEGIVEIVKTCQNKQPQAHIIAMVRILALIYVNYIIASNVW